MAQCVRRIQNGAAVFICDAGTVIVIFHDTAPLSRHNPPRMHQPPQQVYEHDAPQMIVCTRRLPLELSYILYVGPVLKERFCWPRAAAGNVQNV